MFKSTSVRLRCWRLLPAAAVALAALLPQAATAAGEAVSGRKIVDIGCHHGDGVCFITLDGPAFGGAMGCPTGTMNEFRFDDGQTVTGRRSYASFLAAFTAGKTVSVVLSGCTAQGFPALAYFHLTP